MTTATTDRYCCRCGKPASQETEGWPCPFCRICHEWAGSPEQPPHPDAVAGMLRVSAVTNISATIELARGVQARHGRRCAVPYQG